MDDDLQARLNAMAASRDSAARPAPQPTAPADDLQSRLDAMALRRDTTPPPATVAPNSPAALPEEWFEGENAVRAFSRNALNTLTFGGARNAVAAVQHYLRGKDASFEDAYQRNLREDQALNQAHPVAGTLGTGVGAVQAAALIPALLPEAGMAAMYGGGLSAAARSGAIGATLAGAGTLAETHDPKQAAGAALVGGLAGPAADRAIGAVAPLFSSATKLTSREAKALASKPGTPAAFRDTLSDLAVQGAGAAAGGVVGHAAGTLLPSDWGGVGGGVAAAYGAREAIKAMQEQRKALQKDRLYYPRSDRGSAVVGALIPQAIHGLLGGSDK